MPRSLKLPGRAGDVVPSRLKRPPRDRDEMPSDEDVERFGDVTRTCPECGKQVFDDAAVCYHCGYAFERTTAGSTRNPKWIIVTVIVLVLGLVGLALSGVF